MKWAEDAIEKLRQGECVSVRPRGRSMSGWIEDGQLVWLQPLVSEDPEVGEIVLARVRGKKRGVVVLHQIIAVDERGFLIGACNGRVDGWVDRSALLGRLQRVVV